MMRHGGDIRNRKPDILRMTIFRRILLALSFLSFAAGAQAADKLVVAFGDSLMAGYQLPPGDGFVPQLEAALRKGGKAVRVHPAGVSGDTSAQGRARLNWVLGAIKQKPDLVIVEFGANDMLRGLSPAQAEANIDAILAELKKRRIGVLLAGMIAAPNLGPDYGKRFNTIFPKLARKYGVPLYPFFLDGVAGTGRFSWAMRCTRTRPGLPLSCGGLRPTS